MKRTLLAIPLASAFAGCGDTDHRGEGMDLAQTRQALSASPVIKVTYQRRWGASNSYPDQDRFLSASARSSVQPLVGARIELACMTSPTNYDTFGTGFLDQNGEFGPVNVPQGATCWAILRAQLEDDSQPGKAGAYIREREHNIPYQFGMRSFTGGTPGTQTTHLAYNDGDHWAANGLGFLQHMKERLKSFEFQNIDNFAEAFAGLVMETDHKPDSCAVGGGLGKAFCCEFDFGVDLQPATCAHELGHSLEHSIAYLRGAGYPSYPANTEDYAAGCTLTAYDNPIASATESLANYMEYAILYKDANAIGRLIEFYCFASDQPAGDTLNDCAACEFAPSNSEYPVFTHETYCPSRAPAWFECRGLKMLIHLIDSHNGNEVGCLADNTSLPFWRVYDVATSTVPGNGEGQWPDLERTFSGDTRLNSPGNAIHSNEALTLMDIINRMPLTAAQKYRTWARGCYPPAEINSSYLNGKTPVAYP